MQQRENKVPHTKKGGRSLSFREKHRQTRAKYHQELADYVEFESLPFIHDPQQRANLKYQISRNRDEVIKLQGAIEK